MTGPHFGDELDQERWNDSASTMWNESIKKMVALTGTGEEHIVYPEVNAIVWHSLEELLDASQHLAETDSGTLIMGDNDALMRILATVFFVGYDAGKAGKELETYSGICSHKGRNN